MALVWYRQRAIPHLPIIHEVIHSGGKKKMSIAQSAVEGIQSTSTTKSTRVQIGLLGAVFTFARPDSGRDLLR